MSSRGHPKKPALHLSKTGSGAGDDYTNTYSESAVKSANNPMRKAKPAFMSPEVNIGDIHSNNINKIATQEELETSAVNSDGQKVGSPSSDEVSYGKTYTGYEDDKEGIMPEALKASIESFGRKEKNSSPDLDTAHIYHKPGSDLESFSRAGSRPPLFSQNTVRNSLSGSGIVANRVKSFSFGSKSGSFAAGSSSSGSIAAEVKRKPLLQKQQTAVLRNLPKMGPVTKNKAMFERNSVDNPSNHSDAEKKINKLPKGSFKPFLHSKSAPEIIHTKRAWHPTSGPGGAEPAETREAPKFFGIVSGDRDTASEVSTVHSGSDGQSSHEYNSGSEHNYESDKHNKTEPAISTNDVTFGFSGSDLDDTGTLLNLVSLGKINNGGNSSPENISTLDIEGDDSASVKNYKKSLEEHVAEISASLDDSINTSEDHVVSTSEPNYAVVPGNRDTATATVNSNSDEKSSHEYNSGSEHDYGGVNPMNDKVVGHEPSSPDLQYDVVHEPLEGAAQQSNPKNVKKSGGAEPAKTSEDPKFFSVVPGVRAIDTTEVSTVHSGSDGQSSHEYNSGSEHDYGGVNLMNDKVVGHEPSSPDLQYDVVHEPLEGAAQQSNPKNVKKSGGAEPAKTSEDPKFFSVVPGVRAIDTTEVSTVHSGSDGQSSREYNSGSEHGSADVKVDYDNLYNPDEVKEEYNPFPGKICESIAKGKSTKILIEPDSADNNAAGKSTTSTKPIKASSRITDAELKKIYKHRYRPKQKKHSDINIPVSDTVIAGGPLSISSPPISSKSTKGRRFITSLTDRAEVTTKPVSLGFTMPSTTETKHHSISFAGSGYDPVKSDTVADTDYTAPKSTDLRAAAAGKTSEITAPIKAESRLSPAVIATGSVATAKPKAKREPILAASGVIGVTAFGKSSAPAVVDSARPVITGKAAFDPLAIDTEEILLEDITDEISEDILPEKPVVAATVKSSAGSIDRAKPTDAAVTKSATKPATATTKLTGPKLADSELIRLATEIMAKEDEEIPNKLAALKKILKPAAIKDKNIAEEDLLEEFETTEETDHSTEETDHTTEEADHSTDSAATFSDTKPYYWPRSGYGGYAATGYTMPTYGYAASRYVPSSYATFGAIPAVSTVSATANNPVAAVNVQQASFAPVSRAIVPAAYQQRIATNAVQSGTAIHNQSTASDTFTAQNKIAQNSGNGLEDKSLLLGGLTSTGMGGAAIATGVLLASPAVAIILGVMSGASALATGAKAASNKTARTSFTDRLALAQQSDNSTISF